MSDYSDEDVSELSTDDVNALVQLRLQQFPSVQLIRKDPSGLILRTWFNADAANRVAE